MLGREDAWNNLQALIIHYGKLLAANNQADARKMKESICRLQFSGVFLFLLDVIDCPRPDASVEMECIQTIQKYPEIKSWME